MEVEEEIVFFHIVYVLNFVVYATGRNLPIIVLCVHLAIGKTFWVMETEGRK